MAKLFLASTICAIGMATVLLAGSFLSPDFVSRKLPEFADRSMSSIWTEPHIAAVLRRLRILAVGLFLLGALGAAARPRIEPWLESVWVEFVRDILRFQRSARVWLRTITTGELAALSVLLVAGLLLRVTFLHQSVRWDEATSYVRFASRPISLILTHYPEPNNHVLHSLLAHMSLLIFGESLWAYRLPALLAGVLVIPAAFVATRCLYGREAGLVAATVLAFAAAVIRYSTEARGYSMTWVLALLMVPLTLYMRDRESPVAVLLFSLLAALGAFTIPTMVYPFLMLIGWMILSAWKGDTRLSRRGLVFTVLKCCVLTTGIVLLMYLPIMFVSGPRSLYSDPFVQPRPTDRLIQLYFSDLLRNLEFWYEKVPVVLRWILLCGFVLTCLKHERFACCSYPPVAGLVLVAPVVLGQRAGVAPRVFLFVLLFFVVTASAGCGYIMTRVTRSRERVRHVLLGLALTIIALGMLLPFHGATYAVEEEAYQETLEDANAIALFLKSIVRSGDEVISLYPSLAAMQFYGRMHRLEVAIEGTARNGRRIYVVTSEASNDSSLERVRELARIPRQGVSEPVLVKSFPRSKLYLLERIGSF